MVLEDISEGVVLAILIRWDAPVISMGDKQLSRAILAGEQGGQMPSRELGYQELGTLCCACRTVNCKISRW